MAGPVSTPLLQPSADGGQVRFDGAYYDYRDGDARKAIKLWVPPLRPGEFVRGVLLHGNPGGGGGDTRELAADRQLQEYAARHRLGIAGVTWFPSREVFADECKTFSRVFAEFGAMGHHPELTNVPLILRGSSNAGATAYNFVRFLPERVICALPNVSVAGRPYPKEAGLGVPMLTHIGPMDEFFPLGLKEVAETFVELRPRGALWAWTAEQNKKHEIGSIDGIDYAYIEAVLPLRLPTDADPRKGPVVLRTLSPTSGYLADTSTWTSRGSPTGITQITPADGPTSDLSRTVWLPDLDTAFLYRAISTYGPLVRLTADNVSAADNAQASGSLLRNVGSTVVDPGTMVRLTADVSGLGSVNRVEFFDGSRLLGSAPPDPSTGRASIEFAVDPAKRVYSIHALATLTSGSLRTSRPMSFFVRDPSVSKSIDAQLASTAPAALPPAPADSPTENTVPALRARALTAQQEADFGLPNTDLFTPPADPIELTASHRVRGEAGDGARVFAAWGQRGVYLRYQPTGTSLPPGARLDFHLARAAAKTLHSAPAHRDQFLAAQYALPLSGRQFSLALAEAGNPSALVRINTPSPWHMHFGQFTAESLKQRGILILPRNLPDGRIAVDLFIPWSEAGLPMPSATALAPGTRLGLVLGYDTDASGFRWPFALDPWQVPGEAAVRNSTRLAAPVFGDLELLP
jgi:hypothetical protein